MPPGQLLSLLWLFALLNYLYCDLVGLMDSELLRQYLSGRVGGVHLTQGFLLGASALMEIPMAMIVVSRVARRRGNRWANLAAGTVMTLVQAATLLRGPLTGYYLFFSVVEITCTVVIVGRAWTWRPLADR
jgi:hypothetical protein